MLKSKNSILSKYKLSKGALMKKWNSTSDWTVLEPNISDSIIGSNQAGPLDREKWPNWADSSTQIQAFLTYFPNGVNSFSVPDSTVSIVASLRTERYDPKDSRPYNNNFYLIAKSADGQHRMSPPTRPVKLQHHSSESLELTELIGPPPF